MSHSNFSSWLAEKTITARICSNCKETSDQPNQQVFLRGELPIFTEQHLYPGKNQKPAKNEDHPVEPLQKPDPAKNENPPHYQGADDSPLKNLRLVCLAHVE